MEQLQSMRNQISLLQWSYHLFKEDKVHAVAHERWDPSSVGMGVRDSSAGLLRTSYYYGIEYRLVYYYVIEPSESQMGRTPLM